jgi:hypothetical protein
MNYTGIIADLPHTIAVGAFYHPVSLSSCILSSVSCVLYSVFF